MTQLGESEYTPQDDSDESDDEVKDVSIRLCIFFDGTLNNRTNIEQRLLAVSDEELTAEEQKEAENLKKKTAVQKTNEDVLLAKPYDSLTVEELEQVDTILMDRSRGTPEKLYKKHRAKRDKKTGQTIGENSYEGYYTNVVKMDRHLNVIAGETPDYQITLKTYVEGSGSLIKKGDKMSGYALAMGESGVPEKVEKGVRDAIKEITKSQPDREVIIKELTFDVFGFSRGAAAARTFINNALNGKKCLMAGMALSGNDEDTSIKAQLVADGYTVTTVNVCFAGLYDTVSTYGLGVISDAIEMTNDAANNVEALSLRAVAQAEEVVQLASADEHRFHFSLTNIRSAGGKGTEIFLPGVHSDIGGGYRDTVTETLVLRGSHDFVDIILHGNYPSLQEAQDDRDKLVNAGWYKDSEIFVEPVIEKDGEIRWATLRVERSGKNTAGIRNSYSRIPLNFMVKKARVKKIVFEGKFDDDEFVPRELDMVNQEIQDYVAKHEGKGAFTSKPRDWHDVKRTPWLRELRHDYCHFSARMETGHDPRIKNNQRKRMTHNG